MTKHTPTPWSVVNHQGTNLTNGKTYIGRLDNYVVAEDGGGAILLNEDLNEANSDFIVRAVNAHEELLSALKDLVERCDGVGGVRADGSNIETMQGHAAIAKAEGR
jgi:hypothetical protein